MQFLSTFQFDVATDGLSAAFIAALKEVSLLIEAGEDDLNAAAKTAAAGFREGLRPFVVQHIKHLAMSASHADIMALPT